MIHKLARIRSSRFALLAAVAGLAAVTWAPPSPIRGQQVSAEGEGQAFEAHTEMAVDADQDLALAPPPPLPESDPQPNQPQPTGQTTPAEPVEELEEVEFEEVEAALPRLRIDDVPKGTLSAVRGTNGVARVAAAKLGAAELETEEGLREVSIAVVDPVRFRPLTPQVTADAIDVWKRVHEGDGAFTHDTGHRLELELGEHVPTTAQSPLRVGAYASNGAPPVADVLVNATTAERLGIDGPTTLFVALEDEASASNVAERLREGLGLEVTVLDEPQQQRAFLSGSDAKNAFEPFSYVSFGDGMIQIDPDWVRRNIVREPMPILRGEVVCHRLLIPQLRGALQEIEDRGLAHLIDPSQYGGCWVPRHIMFNPRRALSMHAWGIAVDLNVKGNEYGNRNFTMDPRVVEVFDRWGFNWGGRWSTPDAMHFELGAIMGSPEG